MTTTLNQIRSHHPCADGYAKLLKHLNKTSADDEPLSLLTILESNGLEDAIWCLRTEPTLERIQRFTLAISRRIEHLSPTAKTCNDVVERYLNREATTTELNAAHAAAYAAYAAYAAVHGAYAATYAANAAVHVVYAANAADAAVHAAYAAAHAAYAAAAAHAAAYAAADAADAADAAAHAAHAAAAARAAAHTAARAAYAAAHAAQVQIFKELFV
jgi:hypothetical protein